MLFRVEEKKVVSGPVHDGVIGFFNVQNVHWKFVVSVHKSIFCPFISGVGHSCRVYRYHLLLWCTVIMLREGLLEINATFVLLQPFCFPAQLFCFHCRPFMCPGLFRKYDELIKIGSVPTVFPCPVKPDICAWSSEKLKWSWGN